jgi:hypothetical protein
VGKIARFRVWTPDFGEVALDPASENDPRLATFLQEVLDQGLWDQFRRFPLEVVERLLPRLDLPPARRRLLEIWIEEGQRKAAA